MSGSIRKLIGPTKARLQKYLDESIIPAISQSQTQEELYESKYVLRFDANKIKKTVDTLNQYNQEWASLLQQLSGDELVQEEAIYDKVSLDETTGFVHVVLSAQEKLAQMETKIEEIDKAMQRPVVTTQAVGSIVDGVTVVSTPPPQGRIGEEIMRNNPVRLPKLQIPMFFGDPLRWTEFWDVFDMSVHRQPIPDVQKFSYLRSSLRSAAFTAIDGLAVTSQNYPEAIKTLTRRFGNMDVIKDALYAELRNLSVTSPRTHDLRHMVDCTEKILRQLQAFKEDTEHPSVVRMMLEKLPTSILLELERFKKPSDSWTVETLRSSLWDVVMVKERVERLSGHNTVHGQQTNKPRNTTFNQNQPQKPRFTTEALAATVTGQHQAYPPQARNYNMQQERKPPSPCCFCNGPHYHDRCKNVSTVEGRKKILNDKQRCHRCLGSNHRAGQCQQPKKCCFYCKDDSHHSALCPQQFRTAQGRPQSRPNTAANVQLQSDDSNGEDGEAPTQAPREFVDAINNSAVGLTEMQAASSSSHVNLMTAQAVIQSPSETKQTLSVHVFFDPGSQRSFVRQAIADQLQLAVSNHETLSVHTFAAKKPQSMASQVVEFNLILQDGSAFPIQANALPHLTERLHKVPVTQEDLLFMKQFPEKYMAEEVPIKSTSVKPDLMIGLDYFWNIVDANTKIKLPSGLHLVSSKVGLILSGRLNPPLASPPSMKMNQRVYVVAAKTAFNQSVPDVQLHASADTPVTPLPNLEDYWALESIGITDSPYTQDDDCALELFNQTVRFDEGRYSVEWPWKTTNPDLPTNYGLCFGRFKSLTKRLQMDPDLLQKYSNVIQDQLNKGIIEVVSESTLPGRMQHYLPHQPVLTPMKTTTKLRIVYDASAKTTKTSNSLNDCLFRGPVLLPDLCGLLIRFRLQPLVLLSDIEKAFLQLDLQNNSRDVTRFFWYQDPTQPTLENNIQVMRFCRMPFGVVSSPFLLAATIKYHLQQENSQVANDIMSNTYVDNVLLGSESSQQAIKIYQQAKQIFKKVSFNLREWLCNSEEVMAAIPEEDRAKVVKTKVLGILWDPTADTIQISATLPMHNQCTKRHVLQTIAGVYDPLGLAAPVTVQGKILLQELWKRQFDWDDDVTAELRDNWSTILQNLHDVTQVIQSRQMLTFPSDPDCQLIVFADSSTKAYACAAYLRVLQPGTEEVQTALVFAKSRLAPKKTVSLPRLELLAMVIAVRIASFVSQQLRIPLITTTVFSDSECCLSWLRSPKPLSVFVENRVRELRNVKNVSFRYVKSADNPADLATRGITATEWKNSTLWWKGPEWLAKPRETWPATNLPELTQKHIEQIQAETKGPKNAYEASMAVHANCDYNLPIDETRFSSLNKLYRTTIYCLRFLKQKLWDKLSSATQEKHTLLKALFTKTNVNGLQTTEEYQTAEFYWDYHTQRQGFPEFFQTKNQVKLPSFTNQLGIHKDASGILRCYGRLQNSQLEPDARYPKLMPSKSQYTRLLIWDRHNQLHHAGVQHTLAEVRQTHWILKGRSEIANLLSKCFTCKNWLGGPFQLPPMPPLPQERVVRARPFQYVGVDYAGPLFIKQGTEKCKVWLCLFTCMIVRAIHLELVYDMTAQGFLQCLRRFIARRGRPTKIVSDNAPQFKLTHKALDRAWEISTSDEEVMNYLATKQIKWKFINEFAPWEGGFYERLIGQAKMTLKKAIGRKLLTSEQLLTYTTEAEAILNSRPLTYVYSDPASQSILRPVDFLMPGGHIGTEQFDEDHDDPEYFPRLDSTGKLMKFWTSSQQCLDSFWNLWQTEYLASLRERTQLRHQGPRIHSSEQPKVDDVVLIEDDRLPRGCWKPAKITKLITGMDGNCRAAEVQLPTKKLLKRPINRLYPIEISNTHSVASLLLLVCLSLLTTSVSSNVCLNTTSLQPVESQKCVERGVVVLRMTNGDMCWHYKQCKHDDHLDGLGECKPKCPCPRWASDCSHHPNANLPDMTGSKKELLSNAQPNFCSFVPDERCSSQGVSMHLYQIQLYDDTTHYVKDLQIEMREVVHDNYDCIGTGSQTGSESFCNLHKCEDHGTKFCYYKQNEVAVFVSDSGTIPIKAWGIVPVTVYRAKEIQPAATTCATCKLRCIQGGIEISLVERVGQLEICSKPYCYHISQPKTTETIMFPPDTNLQIHDFQAKVWSGGLLIKKFGVQCPSLPYCETIKCYVCITRFANPQCAPTIALVLLFVLLYFFSMSIYILAKTSKALCLGVYCMSYATYQMTRGMIRLCMKIKHGANQKLLHTMAPEISESKRPTITYKPSSKLIKINLAFVFILFGLSTANGCGKVTTLNAQQSVCSQTKNGSLECLLTDTVRLALVPQGQQSCLLLKDPLNEPMGTLTLEVQKISLRCKPKNHYFTRAYQVLVSSRKRCSGAGTCEGTKCGKIDVDTKIPELEEANKHPGYTFCKETCGGAACGCVWPTSACLFYRYYVIPKSDKLFEVFSCPTWTYSVTVNAHLTLQKSETEHTFSLQPGIEQSWNRVKVTLISITQPPTPLVTYKFLTDGTRTTMVTPAAAGTPIAGMVGSMQCRNEEAARNFDCDFPAGVCKCQAQDSKAKCHCVHHPLEKLFKNGPYVLPTTTDGLTLSGKGHNIDAQFSSIASLEMQVSLDSLKLSTKIHKNQCNIHSFNLTGCYNCLAGAQLTYTCTTDFGQALAHVLCGLAKFSTVCKASGFKGSTRLSFSDAQVNEKCIVECPASTTTFDLFVTLAFVENSLIMDTSNVVASDEEEVNENGSSFRLDFGFLTKWFQTNWVKSILLTIAAIILAICSVPILIMLSFRLPSIIYGFMTRNLKL